MIKIENDKMPYSIYVPTSLEEIDIDYLNQTLDNVVVAPNYCIIALIYKTKLFSLISNMKSNQNGTVQCVVKLAKSHNNELVQGNIIGNTVVINRSSIEMGTHLTIPDNILNPIEVAKYCEKDPDLVKAILTGAYFNDGTKTSDHVAKLESPYCYFVEFKMVPYTDICGGFTPKISKSNKFKEYKVNKEVN